MQEVFCTTSCHYREAEQTCLSKYVRISLCVLGVLAIIVASLNLAGVNGFSWVNEQVGQTLVSLGIFGLIISSVKRVKVKNLTQPNEKFLSQFPEWIQRHIKTKPLFKFDESILIQDIQDQTKAHPVTSMMIGENCALGIWLTIRHLGYVNSDKETHVHNHSTKEFSQFVLIEQNASGTYELMPGLSESIQHRNKGFQPQEILPFSRYRLQNYDDARCAKLCKFTKQDDANLSNDERFSLEWILGNIFSGKSFWICEYEDGDKDDEVIGYWQVQVP